jgi:hypothetical protein
MEASMSTVIAKPNARLKTFADVLTEWLTDLARVHSLARREPIVIGERDYALYADALSDLTTEQLHAAFLRASQVCRFFPTPADIRLQVEDAEAKGLQLEAEAAWSRAMDYALNCWHPDIGFTRNTPELPAKLEHAIRAAGGVRCLHNCPESELHWRKKDFIGDYVRLQELGQDQHLLSDGEAKQIIKQLSNESQNTERRQLVVSAHSPTSGNMTNEEIRALTNQVVKRLPPTLVDLTAEEESRRIQQLRRQAELLRSTYPESWKHAEANADVDAVLTLE